MLFVALGDSITHGYNCTNESNRFANLLYQQLKKQYRTLNPYILSKPGWKVANLCKAVESLPSCIWDETKYVSILIGGNDLLRALPVLLSKESRITHYAQTFQKHLTQLIQMIKRPNMIICLGTLYNPFPNSILAERCVSEFNDVIRNVARRHHLRVADLHAVFQLNEKPLIDGYKKGELRDFKLFRNPIHPTDLGHAKIAQVFLQSLRKHAGKKGFQSIKSNRKNVCKQARALRRREK
jgi:lysophospholipase L1-like esterase